MGLEEDAVDLLEIDHAGLVTRGFDEGAQAEVAGAAQQAFAFTESPASSSTSQAHTREAVNECRGSTSARIREKVRPQPPRAPRLE